MKKNVLFLNKFIIPFIKNKTIPIANMTIRAVNNYVDLFISTAFL